MNKEALFSDGTSEYTNPCEPDAFDTVRLRLRTAKGDNLRVSVFVLESGKELTCLKEESTNDEVFEFYDCDLTLEDKLVTYYFKIRSNEGMLYYDRFGVSDSLRPQYFFKICPGFHTPSWAKGAVMYQILVDRFCNGDESNDVEENEYHYINTYSHHVADWNTPPADFDVANFYGGDLEGVRQKLYYLKSLGIEAVYFNPLFVSPSNHKYDIQDYDYIDPHFGKIVKDGGENLKPGDYDNKHATKFIERVTNKENLEATNKFFVDFVEEAHSKGIRVILDGVFNHCGSFNKWLDRERIYEGREGYEPGAYISKDSPYHSFFQFYEDKWPYNKSYDGWWGNDTLPKLNYEGSKELEDYIINIGRKWVSPPYNCDGWRLDVAADLGHSPEYNHHFWQRFRKEVKDANPDAVILAEHYGDASSWLSGDQWDTIMNYDAFMEPVSFFLTGMEKHSDRFESDLYGNGRVFEITMRHAMCEFLTPSLYCSMNQLSNHDHSRFLTRTNHKVGRVAELGSAAAGENVSIPVMKLAALIQMTWPGAPTIYYGDEAGVVGFTDPDSRRTYPWGNADYELIDYHRDLIYMRRFNEALRTGALNFLSSGRNYICYARFNETQKIVIMINSGEDDLETDVPVWKAEVPLNCQMHMIFGTNKRGYSLMSIKCDVVNGYVHAKLSGMSGVVFVYEK
ncbi:MAG: glycoside hydrolase family 13 protein [Lachnospiraceae bacterium]|uniref:Glycoside hydrolase family 13 protein n=1 Tax=Candidatus Weimeria bifida TaxID=2599074 RepID=A0A6N7IZ12_9FIRM|nr:glycoside hydrolase family 13 protein [Candidatus Weimeria bifida]RRF95189.1 MAG: glycoside hydrolase family 13 protein [Lachnospiraceae bacterium]